MRLIVFLALICAFASCDNELNIIEESKDIPIVYGLLSPSDTAQYIRIEKAFVDASTSALVLAQEPDSLYYDDDKMLVQLINDNNPDETFTLERVDGNLEGYVREEGAFAQSPNYLYKVKTEDLNFGETGNYTLRIDRGDDLPLITGETSLVGPSLLFSPNPLSSTARIEFDETKSTRFSWANGTNAIVYDLILILRYNEKEIGGVFESKSFTWPLAEGLNDNEFNQPGLAFFTRIASELEEKEDIERKFVSVDVIIQGGNSTLLNYVRIGQANLGITSTQDVPTFTNLDIEGDNSARGIFGARYVNRYPLSFPITPVTLDSLINGRFTKDLSFVR